MGASETSVPGVIFDLGSHNGSDIPYYLLKADKVVAVEENPALAKDIEVRFAAEVEEGRLIIENCVLTDNDNLDYSDFYINTYSDLLSQVNPPSRDQSENFRKVRLPAKSISRLFTDYGLPYYVKIDLEGFDSSILKMIAAEKGCPPYISSEAHSIDIFCQLVSMGYRSFKVLSGAHIQDHYASIEIESRFSEVLRYEFVQHSSGPFGNDIPHPWMDSHAFLRLLSVIGPGWIDIHASRLDESEVTQVRRATEIASTTLMMLAMRLSSKRLHTMSRRLWGLP